MHPPSAAEVAAAGADLCVCLDGDADRVVLVDPASGVLDGDDLLWLLSQGDDGPLVGTIMSNGGLEAALGDRLVRAPVGDRYVAERMAETGARFGAEPSGHVLFADGMPTGDGLYSALRALAAVARGGRPVQPLPVGGWTRWPQVNDAVRFTGPRVSLDLLRTLRAVRASGQRAVVRYSGTEPKLRIMVEGMGTGALAPARLVAEIAHEFRALLDARPAAG
jgi:phosphoglucosamine mutase